MEWTKEKLEKTCILITSETQGNKVIKFYKSFGYFQNVSKDYKVKFDINNYIGVCETKGLDSTKLAIWHELHRPEFMKIIKLPSKPRRKFPREMMVSIDEINWLKRTVFAKIKTEYPYIADASNQEIKTGYIVASWKYAKEIDDSTAS